MNVRCSTLVGASVVALLLAGCAGSGTPASDPSSSEATSSTATPRDVSPVPTEEAPAPVEPSEPAAAALPPPSFEDLVVSTSGLGPLAIGVPPESNAGAAMIRWSPDECADMGIDDPGRWVTTYPLVDGGYPTSVAVDDVGVSWIDVLKPGPHTAEGVGIGTDLTTLQATYPNLVAGTPGPVSNVWWLAGPDGYLVFETQGDDDGLQPAGTPEQVILMRVLTPASDPDFATANSDWVAGGCL